MAKIRLFWLVGTVSALAFASLQGCGSDDDTSGTGSAGTTGTGGASGGKAGTTSTGGASGGKAGTTSSGGAAGKGGTSSSGGASSGGASEAGGAEAGGAGAYSVCEEYCTLDATKCPTLFGTDYGTAEDCETACADMPVGDEGASTGDSVECRISHAGYADGTDDAQHCPHASKDSAAGGCL
jgi:hypothetical protein